MIAMAYNTIQQHFVITCKMPNYSLNVGFHLRYKVHFVIDMKLCHSLLSKKVLLSIHYHSIADGLECGSAPPVYAGRQGQIMA